MEEPEPGTLMRAAIDAMLDELDPYTVYYPESRIEDIRFMNTGEYGGIGALVQPIDGEMTIVEVYEGYPAHEVGMKPGDIVRDVDGRAVDADMDSEAVSDLLQGESGSAVTVGIDRPFGGGRIEFEVERTKVRIPAVTYSGMLDDRTGYIYLSKFTRGSAGEAQGLDGPPRLGRHGAARPRSAGQRRRPAQRKRQHCQPLRSEGHGNRLHEGQE